jgi:hypothetical protein
MAHTGHDFIVGVMRKADEVAAQFLGTGEEHAGIGFRKNAAGSKGGLLAGTTIELCTWQTSSGSPFFEVFRLADNEGWRHDRLLPPVAHVEPAVKMITDIIPG